MTGRYPSCGKAAGASRCPRIGATPCAWPAGSYNSISIAAGGAVDDAELDRALDACDAELAREGIGA
jgi:hypothetical protein